MTSGLCSKRMAQRRADDDKEMTRRKAADDEEMDALRESRDEALSAYAGSKQKFLNDTATLRHNETTLTKDLKSARDSNVSLRGNLQAVQKQLQDATTQLASLTIEKNNLASAKISQGKLLQSKIDASIVQISELESEVSRFKNQLQMANDHNKPEHVDGKVAARVKTEVNVKLKGLVSDAIEKNDKKWLGAIEKNDKEWLSALYDDPSAYNPATKTALVIEDAAAAKNANAQLVDENKPLKADKKILEEDMEILKENNKMLEASKKSQAEGIGILMARIGELEVGEGTRSKRGLDENLTDTNKVAKAPKLNDAPILQYQVEIYQYNHKEGNYVSKTPMPASVASNNTLAKLAQQCQTGSPHVHEFSYRVKLESSINENEYREASSTEFATWVGQLSNVPHELTCRFFSFKKQDEKNARAAMKGI